MPGGSDESRCKTMMTNTMRMATVAAYMLGFFSAVIFCNFLNVFLRPLSQPRIISEFIVGVALSNIPFIRKSLNNEVHKTLNYIADVGMICQMFVVGLDMDPNMFLHFPVREAKVASAGVLTTFILAAVSIPYLHIPHIQPSKINLTLAVILSGTASPLLTRLITDLKISKSDIGRFVITTGILSDLFATLLVSLGAILFDPSKMFAPRAPNQAFLTTATLVIEIVFSAKATPILMNWVNQENPEGKPMKGPHLVLSVAYVVMVCSFSPVLVQYNKVLSAFLAGVLMPREGRIAKMMINKVKYFFTSIFYPLFFFWVGTEAELPKFQAGTLRAWENLICLFLISTVGKLLGTVVSGVMLGFRWPESIAIGLLLNIKGHFQIYLAIIAATMLRHAPCSVGILVDRGLGSTKLSRSSMPINVAVIFIGGKDDREALSYAGRVARHPGVKLTVIRFLLDANTENASSTLSKARLNTAEHQEEMKLDDEYFAEFYGRHVAAGHVAYMEKYLVNSGQTFSTLRSLEGEYALFIVGRGGGRVNSLLTAGMNDWEECPELGPIGDILSASDYSVTSSVLIIQQHSLRGELDGHEFILQMIKFLVLIINSLIKCLH